MQGNRQPPQGAITGATESTSTASPTPHILQATALKLWLGSLPPNPCVQGGTLPPTPGMGHVTQILANHHVVLSPASVISLGWEGIRSESQELKGNDEGGEMFPLAAQNRQPCKHPTEGGNTWQAQLTKTELLHSHSDPLGSTSQERTSLLKSVGQCFICGKMYTS